MHRIPLLLAASLLATSTTPSFEARVNVLPYLGFGFEPTLVGDRFGNLFSTAHKDFPEAAAAVVSVDTDSTTATRSMSWARMSVDGGKTWSDIPGLYGAGAHYPGLEGDMAFDDAGHLYFADTWELDSTITRWTVGGLGKIAHDFTRLLIRTAQKQDDRPWLAAHGDGHVFYIANQPELLAYTGPARAGSGFGPGYYTVYASYDGGRTFDAKGYTLKDSGSCRPAVDHTAGSQYVFVACSDYSGTLYSYVSADDGRSFERYFIAHYANESSSNDWPTLVVAPNGDLFVLRPDGTTASDDTRLMLYRSTDRGKTWTAQDITPEFGRYQFAWLSVAPDGRLGMSVYHVQHAATERFKVYGAIWRAGDIPKLISADDAHPVTVVGQTIALGDYTASWFTPDGRLNIAWNSAEDRNPTGGSWPFNHVWFARTR
jgi:hypothetical protein